MFLMAWDKMEAKKTLQALCCKALSGFKTFELKKILFCDLKQVKKNGRRNKCYNHGRQGVVATGPTLKDRSKASFVCGFDTAMAPGVAPSLGGRLRGSRYLLAAGAVVSAGGAQSVAVKSICMMGWACSSW